MDNLDALITDLQAATAAMSAQYDDENYRVAAFDSGLAAFTAEEDAAADVTWGLASSAGKIGSPTAPPFPKFLPSPASASPPAALWAAAGNWQNGFGESGGGSSMDSSTTAVRSPVLRTPVGAAAVSPPAVRSPASFPWPKVTAAAAAGAAATATATPCVATGSSEALPTIRSASYLSSASPGTGHVIREPPSTAVAALPVVSDGPVSYVGVTHAPTISCSTDTMALPLLLPSPPARVAVDGFCRTDNSTDESFYEPQNLAAIRSTLSTAADVSSGMAATTAAPASAECRWRVPQLRAQPAGIGISPLVRSSLAHNLNELDALLQELGAGSPCRQQQPPLEQQPMSDMAGRGMTTAVEPTRASPPRAAESTPDQRAVYAPVLSQRGIAKLQQQQPHQQEQQQPRADIFAGEYPSSAPRGQAVATDGSDMQNRHLFEQQVQQRVQPQQPLQEHSAAASFATRELDELMATLSQLKVNTAQSPARPAAAAGQAVQLASPAVRPQAGDNPLHRQQQQFSGARLAIDTTSEAEGPFWSGGLPQHALLMLQQQPQQRSGMNGQAVSSPRLQEPFVDCSGAGSSSGSGGPPSATSSPSLSRGGSNRSGGGDLDNMLDRLETDLSRQGAKVIAKGNCAACDKAVVGQVVTALGRLWHPEHFCCTQCRCELARISFFERDGLPYCEDDYHELFAPKCARCGDPVVTKCVTALGITWHPECFTCGACARPLADEAFHEKDGSVYCPDDFFDLFSPRCGSCSLPIYDNFVSALNRHWHPPCFVCMDCGAKFNGSSFFDHDGLPFCETHYHSRKGSLCSGCQKPVLGRCIAAMGKKFHPEHFACAFCLRQLNKGTFKEQNDKPYCHACFGKLFG